MPDIPASRARSDLSRFLNPRGVAVVGVSGEPDRIGGQALRLLADFGYTGRVYPVNPKYGEVRGLTCYPDLLAVPQPCDVALIALSAPHVIGAIEQCGRAGIPYALVLAGGFSEVGAEGRALQEKLVAAARKANVRMVGPNCLGILNLRDNARIGFGGTAQLTTLKPGPMAMVTQSGGFGFGVVAIAAYFGVGCNYAISSGNEADLTLLDWVAYLIERDDVEVVVAFMEGITEGRRLIEIGERALELGKPILVWKVGNTDIGSRAATSHSARLTSGYELYRAAFRRGGLVEIRDVDDLVDVAKAFFIRKLPAGNRVGVLTLSGGAGVLLADRCVESGLALPEFAPATTEKLKETLVSFASSSNPVDATANGYNDNFASYGRAVELVLADPNVDQVLVRIPRGKSARPWAENLMRALGGTDKPLVMNWPTSPDDNGDVLKWLEENGVPCILGAGRAVRALAALTEFSRKRREQRRRGGRAFVRAAPRGAIDLPAGGGPLGEHRSKQVLSRYGMPVVRERLLAPEEIESLAAAPLPFPLAVKIESPDVPHKTEAGAVQLGIGDLATLKQAAREVVAAARAHAPGARIEGVLVQEMAAGTEVIAGSVNDPSFGPTVTFGLGGIFTELMGDVTHRFAPFDTETALEMIREIRGSRVLTGYRGRPALDVAALADALARLSLLAADHADRIAEIDVNPLFVREAGKGVVAADALVVMKTTK
ncbi:MAG: acetate--CoA ligase family protein [Burkholderiales bacterium]|nr:acetate--CoA ligase family protein [Burkholderiales bacterium]